MSWRCPRDRLLLWQARQSELSLLLLLPLLQCCISSHLLLQDASLFPPQPTAQQHNGPHLLSFSPQNRIDAHDAGSLFLLIQFASDVQWFWLAFLVQLRADDYELFQDRTLGQRLLLLYLVHVWILLFSAHWFFLLQRFQWHAQAQISSHLYLLPHAWYVFLYLLLLSQYLHRVSLEQF